MKRRHKLLIGSLLTLGVLLATPQPHWAQGGCLGSLTPVTAPPGPVVQTIPVAAGVAETPSGQTPHTFHQVQVRLTYQPGQALWLRANQGATALPCVDDLLTIRNLTNGRLWQHDFRSADRTRIVPHTPVNLAERLGLVGGDNRLEISFIDLTPGFYSAAPLYLLLGPPPAISPTLTPTNAPTASATTQPTSTSSATPTPATTPTRLAPAKGRVNSPPTQTDQGWPLGPLALGVPLGGGLLALLTWRLARARPPLPIGQCILYTAEGYHDTVSLALYGKPVVYLGRGAGDIILPDPEVAELAARISSHRRGSGQEDILEILDPDNPAEVIDRFVLQDGDTHYFGQYRLVYQCYQPEEPFYTFDEGGLHV